MSAIDIATALLRGLHLAALVSLFGTLVFAALVLPADREAERTRGVLRSVAFISGVASLLLGLVWLALQSAQIAGTGSVATTLHALPVVALRTQFGHWLLLRLGVLIVALELLRFASLAIPLTAVALAIQPLLGHAGAISGAVGTELIASEALHLLAAGAWLGGLLPLYIAIARLPHETAAAVCRGFTPIGLSAVLLLAGTAVVQTTALMGGLPGLLGTSYGHVALLKLSLFVVLLALAAVNRFVLTEHLARNPGTRPIRGSISAEILLGLAIIIAAGFLASRMPGTHEQPVWPLPWRPSLASFGDPDLRLALGAVVIGIAVAVLGILWRRARWPALVAALVIEVLALPRLGLLFVSAYPTSFFTSPTEFAATAIVHGAHLFAANCAVCHGADARGDGPAAQSLPVHPADLTAEHLWSHSDGELYWLIAHGFDAPDGTTTMPGFAAVLSTEGIWDLIDYLRANNAGDTMHRTGRWPQPVAMPQFDAQCADGRTIDLDDLRGRPLLLIAVPDDESWLPREADVTTVLVSRDAAAAAIGSACIANEPQVWTALGILLGVPSQALPGTHVLVDSNGWLRDVWRRGDSDPTMLIARLHDIVAHPLSGGTANPQAHHHSP